MATHLEVVRLQHGLELSQLLVRDLPLPLQLPPPLGDHGDQALLPLHPLLEGLGEVGGANLANVPDKGLAKKTIASFHF